MKTADNVLIICTDRRTIGLYEKVLEELGIDIDIECLAHRFGEDIDKALEYIDSFKKKGKEIIVTRGYMAKEIRRSLDFKVIEIAVSSFDVLNALYKYMGRDVNIGIVECREFIDSIMPVAELFGLRTTPYVVEVFQDFYDYFAQAAADGVDVICGGAMGHYDDFFTDIGVEYASVDSSERTIRDSLVNALEIYQLVYEEKKKREMIETLVNVSDMGTIASDSEGTIIAANRKAGEILNFDSHKAVGKDIEKLCPDIEREQLAKMMRTPSGVFDIMGKKVLTDRIPLTLEGKYLGFVLRIRRTDQIISDESRVRSILAKKGLQARYSLEDIKGKSPAIERLKNWVEHYARTDSTILITGESGTGKELFAQTVHNASNRKSRPFLAINCSAFSPNLLESELFGYVDGAFTGARKEGKIGVFELAHTGTLFLDEIGDMDPSVQAKILRVIQEKEFMRVGDDKIISVDVRIIAATNRNLFEEVLKGNFREDLYYRLNVLNLSIPPLRERKEDIEDLAMEALFSVNDRLGCKITGIDENVIERLKEYDWHGNVRELNSFIEKMVALIRSGRIVMAEVEGLFRELDIQIKTYKQFFGERDKAMTSMTLRQAEDVLIDSAMKETGYNKTKAAEKLGIDRATLIRKLQKKENGSK